MNCFIYGLKDPNTLEIRYIGQTSQGFKRPEVHVTKSALKNKTHRSSWIKSILPKKPIIVVLESCSKEDLNSLEIKWIKYAKDNNWNLTNHDSGGSGIRGFKHSDETKKKISNASKLMWKTNPIKMTDEAKYKCGSSHRGKTMSDDFKLKAAQVKGTSQFKVYNRLDNSYIGTFSNISECARVLNIYRRTISYDLRNIRKSKDFIFEKVS